MQYPRLVGRDLNVLDQGRVAPDAERVVRKAARADDLAVVRAPPKAGHLRARVDAVGARARGRVPEVDVTVVGASTGSEEVELPGTPAESLDGGAMVGLAELGRRQRTGIPDRDEVVIPARR